MNSTTLDILLTEIEEEIEKSSRLKKEYTILLLLKPALVDAFDWARLENSITDIESYIVKLVLAKNSLIAVKSHKLSSSQISTEEFLVFLK